MIILFLIFTFNLIICENNSKKLESLKLNTPTHSKISVDDSYNFYELELPEEVAKDKILIFTVKQSFKNIKINEEIFSDPNIYISKSNKYPSNREEADWYSEQYGNDILTIPKYALDKNEKFYIGLYCERKCNYELNAYLSNEVEIELGRIYYIKIPKKSSQSYFIKIEPNLNYEELNVVANCPSMKSFKIFMSKDSPSSQNTFKVIPSWEGGYTINIDKKNENFCKNCNYHILLQTQNEDVEIQLNAYIQNYLTNIKMSKPVYDTVKKEGKRCYKFRLNEEDINNKEQIVIQTNMYSGLIYLHISGFNQEPEKDFKDIKHEIYSYRIETSQIILLRSEDINRFLMKHEQRRHESGNKYIYFCIYGQLMSSYILNVFLLSKGELNQGYNYISPGSEITGYLLQNQATKYELLDYNINSNTNITLNINNLQGKAKFYTFFSNTKINIDNNSFDQIMKENEVLVPEYISSQLSTIVIKSKSNKCYQNNNKLKNDNNNCKIYLAIKCEDTENNNRNKDICSFRISTIYEDKPILLSPKRTYFNFIPKGKQDIYEILITEKEINSLVVVLNTASGDAELTLKKKKDMNEIGLTKNTQLIGISRKDDYIPDVIRVTPLKLLSDDLIGRYIVFVSAKTFSSYNLYYYTTLKEIKETELSLSDVTASLKEGQIIKDYFPNDIDFKIYSYIPETKTKTDIKIILTRINVKFNFYIFKHFNKIKFKKNLDNIYIDKVRGYDWASDINNEITISKDDPKYSLNEVYYILVIKDESEETENKNFEDITKIEENAIMTYYIGVTKEGIPFNIFEGIEHSETLSENYKSQTYFYSHYDIQESFILDLMILNGDIDIFIDIKEINENDIELIRKEEYLNLRKSIHYKLNVNNYYTFELTKEYFEEYCKNKQDLESNNHCPIFIYITQGKLSTKNRRDSQYIISTKSSKNKGKLLLSGNIYQGEIPAESSEYFYIEEVKAVNGFAIYVNLYSPGGEVYVRIPKETEIGKNIIYPNSTFYDYKGKNNYNGKEVKIPSSVFDRAKSLTLKIQILITIEATNLFYIAHGKNLMKYSIYFSSEIKRINQNIPYTFYIQQGEYHYYTFYFDSNTENIYISLSNMNGDADLYLNYGNEDYPTPDDHHWSSLTSGQEYITINKEDKFYVEKKLNNLSGYYTLLVTGVTNTTYTLFVSSFKEKVFPLYDNTPINCRCEKKGEKCYFRYNRIFKDSPGNKINYNEIIFTSEYKYGNGKMYAKVLKERDLNNNFKNKQYISFFPNDNDFQFSNRDKGKRNYMKVKVDQNNYSKDSLILMTIICDEKTDAEITTSSLTFYPTSSNIIPERENTYYIKYNFDELYRNHSFNYYFYSMKAENIFYQIHVYTGKAKIKISLKEEISKFAEKKEETHISEFIISNDDSEKIKYDYLNYISKTMVKNKYVSFEISPLSDFGFFIQLIYDKTWAKIPINKEKKLFIKNNLALAYFNIFKVYSSIDVNFNMKNCASKKLKIYLKFEVYDKKEDFMNQDFDKDLSDIFNDNDDEDINLSYYYEVPSEHNYDYKATIYNFMCSANINIPDLPEYEDLFIGKKVVRALLSFNIVQDDENFISKPMEVDDDDEDDYYDYKKKRKKKGKKKYRKDESKESIVSIMVTPTTNNIKRINLSPYNFYYSKTSLFELEKQNAEIKIYSMDIINEKDENIIINLHLCSGKYDIKVSSKIVSYDDNQNDIYFKEAKDEINRKYIYFIPNLKQKHIYVTIKPKISPQCNYTNKSMNYYNYLDDFIQNNCSSELKYLINYYSGSQMPIIDSEIKGNLRYRREKKLIWVKIPALNNYEYNIFWTKYSESFYKMDCICYLNELVSDIKKGINDEIHFQQNIQLNENNEFLIEEKDLRQNVYVMVVSRNIKTNELANFNPLIIKGKKGVNVIYVIIYVIVIILLYLFIRRLSSKSRFDLSKKNDDETSEIEMASHRSNNQGYSTLRRADF